LLDDVFDGNCVYLLPDCVALIKFAKHWTVTMVIHMITEY